MSLTNKSPASTYKDLLYVDNNNNGVDSTKRQILSGGGTSSSMQVSDRGLLVKSETDNTSALDIQNSGGTSKLLVDTTNSYVKANGVHVNTQYAYFNINNEGTASFGANTHYAVNHSGNAYTAPAYPISFGTSTDPATTFTTAEGNGTRGSNLTTVLWYAPDAISVDSVVSIEGADTADGATTRMHLMSYTLNSGSTSALSAGTLIAHNTPITNLGSEQVYKSTWIVDSAAVTAGKVLVATFLQADTSDDYSLNIVVKYHITG